MYFFEAIYLLQDGGSELFCSDGGGNDFTMRKKKKADGVKYGNNRAGKTSWRLFPLPIIENSSGDGSLAEGLAKTKALYRHSWPFKPKNHSKSLLGPHECKLQ